MDDPYRSPQIGDTIETDLNYYPLHLECELVTPESVEFARQLIAARRWKHKERKDGE
jgi:hypothetical protein